MKEDSTHIYKLVNNLLGDNLATFRQQTRYNNELKRLAVKHNVSTQDVFDYGLSLRKPSK